MTVDTSFARRFIDIEQELGGHRWFGSPKSPRPRRPRRRRNRGTRLFGISNRHWMLFLLIWFRPRHKREHPR